ncbi:hypothetical protein HD554DRAFT_2082609 [Boletus coccyginus]|nr:hypothetical protein HD554DRAFT_2082609 [Boletus coccyginus]
MQFAGFRSVIGTMWAMVDESGRLDHTRAAFALNKTMQFVNIPFGQRMLYVHLGA